MSTGRRRDPRRLHDQRQCLFDPRGRPLQLRPQRDSPQVSLTNTIVAGNTGPNDVNDAVDQVTGSYNLIGIGGPGLAN